MMRVAAVLLLLLAATGDAVRIVSSPEQETSSSSVDVVSLLECVPTEADAEGDKKFCADTCRVVPPSRPQRKLRCEEKAPERKALSLAQMKEQVRMRGDCPPPQPCSCHCYCPEIVWPVPPPAPLLPTPAPFFGLLQTGQQTTQVVQHQVPQTPAQPMTQKSVKSEALRLLQMADKNRPAGQKTKKGKQPGTALPPPGAPINLLPPPPAPPLPPMPKDFRGQPCPENSPCNCYCHCRAPPQ